MIEPTNLDDSLREAIAEETHDRAMVAFSTFAIAYICSKLPDNTLDALLLATEISTLSNLGIDDALAQSAYGQSKEELTEQIRPFVQEVLQSFRFAVEKQMEFIKETGD